MHVCEPDIVASSREVFSTTLVRADEPSKEPAHRLTHARACMYPSPPSLTRLHSTVASEEQERYDRELAQAQHALAVLQRVSEEVKQAAVASASSSPRLPAVPGAQPATGPTKPPKLPAGGPSKPPTPRGRGHNGRKDGSSVVYILPKPPVSRMLPSLATPNRPTQAYAEWRWQRH